MLNPSEITLANLPETMTEAEAWREIARSIAEDEWRQFGLCYEVDRLYEATLLTNATREAMRSRIRGAVYDANFTDIDGDNRLWLCQAGETGPRILLALLFAELAEDGE